MRWIVKKPEHWDTKIKRKFALFPIRIGDEVRWLEWVTIRYRFIYAETEYDSDVWVKESFVN